MRITKANIKAIKYACKHFHYSKTTPVNVFGYNVYNDTDEWCGCVVYGTGANNRIGNPYNLKQGEVIELVRVALNGKQSTTSQVLAMTLRAIKSDLPICRLVVSYADIDQNHAGIIYQATNWIYEGDTTVNSLAGFILSDGTRVHGKTIDSRIAARGGLKGLSRIEWVRKYVDKNAENYITKGKRKYLFPLDKKMKKQIAHLAKPYPKNGGTQKQ